MICQQSLCKIRPFCGQFWPVLPYKLPSMDQGRRQSCTRSGFSTESPADAVLPFRTVWSGHYSHHRLVVEGLDLPWSDFLALAQEPFVCSDSEVQCCKRKRGRELPLQEDSNPNVSGQISSMTPMYHL